MAKAPELIRRNEKSNDLLYDNVQFAVECT